VGEETPEKINEMERKVEKAASDALLKRKKIIDYIRNL
jgi:hydrogenase maturation factor HypE